MHPTLNSCHLCCKLELASSVYTAGVFDLSASRCSVSNCVTSRRRLRNRKWKHMCWRVIKTPCKRGTVERVDSPRIRDWGRRSWPCLGPIFAGGEDMVAKSPPDVARSLHLSASSGVNLVRSPFHVRMYRTRLLGSCRFAEFARLCALSAEKVGGAPQLWPAVASAGRGRRRLGGNERA